MALPGGDRAQSLRQFAQATFDADQAAIGAVRSLRGAQEVESLWHFFVRHDWEDASGKTEQLLTAIPLLWDKIFVQSPHVFRGLGATEIPIPELRVTLLACYISSVAKGSNEALPHLQSLLRTPSPSPFDDRAISSAIRRAFIGVNEEDFRGIEKLQEEMRQITIARRTSILRDQILALADSSLMLFRVGVLFCSEIAADSQAIKDCRAKYEKLGARVRLGILDNPFGGPVQTTGLTQLLGVLPF